MKYILHIDNERGMTLIEILGALTILSIVLITFMSVLPQSIIMSHEAEDELTALNVAERVLVQVKENPELATQSFEPIIENERTFYPVVEIQSDIDHHPTEIEFGLMRIRINVYSTDPSSGSILPSAQLFGYIELEDE